MIRFEEISKIYHPKTVVLTDVNLSIEKGEFVFLVGASGSGKSTLMKLLTGEERTTSGEITVDDQNIRMLKRRELPLFRRSIGVVYQDFKLLEKKTAQENIAFALEACGLSNKHIREVLPHVLKIVGLEEKADRYPCELSGGEQQRVAIARALVHRPPILIADEPTGDLDSLTAKTIVDLLLKINESGTTIIFVTHNRDIVNMLKKRVITLHGGTITSDKKGGKYVL